MSAFNRARNLAGILCSSLVLLGLSSCNDHPDFANAPGNYQGYALLRSAVVSTQVFVSAVATLHDSSQIEMVIQSTDTSPVHWDWNMSVVSDSQIKIESKDGSLTSLTLNKSSTGCYDAPANGSTPGPHLCFDGNELSANIPLSDGQSRVNLVLDHSNSGAAPVLETPASYTLEQLLDRASKQNFGTQIEFEHVVQANLTAQSALLNLLPHFNANDILNVASLSIPTIVKSIGDFVPFLLPDHWFHAEGDVFKSDAEHEAWLSMKVDTAGIVEGLVISIIRDENGLAKLSDEGTKISHIIDEIVDKEKSGLLQAGSSDDVKSVLNESQRAVVLLQQFVADEYAALAQTCGFFNPLAVTTVSATFSRSIDNPEVPTNAVLSELALERSLELKETDFLVDAAQMFTDERVFTWLNPTSGDNAGSMGLGWGDYIGIGKSQINELMIKRQEVQSILLQNVATTLGDIAQTIQAYKLAVQDTDVQSRRVDRLEGNLRTGINFSLSDLLNALEQESQNDIEQLNEAHAYLTLMSKVDRLTYAGAYGDILKQ